MTPLIVAMGMILIASIPEVRDGIGEGLNVIFGPLVDSFHIPFYIVIIILSAITAVYSSTIQKYTIDYAKMKLVQEKMKAFHKEYREAMLAKDEKRVKKNGSQTGDNDEGPDGDEYPAVQTHGIYHDPDTSYLFLAHIQTDKF